MGHRLHFGRRVHTLFPGLAESAGGTLVAYVVVAMTSRERLPMNVAALTPDALVAHLVVDGTDLEEIVSVRIVAGVSEDTAVTIVIARSVDRPLDVAPLTQAALVFYLGGLEALRFTLRIEAVRFVGVEGGALRYEVSLYEPYYFLRLSKATRKFRDESAVEVAERVLGGAGVEVDRQLLEAYAPLPWTVQYRETHHAFLERLLASEGIYRIARPDGGITLCDDSRAAELVAKEPFEIIEAAGGLIRGAQGIHDIELTSSIVPGAVGVCDVDWKKANWTMIESVSGERDADLEVFDFPGGFRDPASGKKKAQQKLEAIRARAKVLRGSGNILDLRPGSRMRIGGSTGPVFEGECFVLRVEHEYRSPAFRKPEDEQRTYSSSFQAIPAAARYRPPQAAKPSIVGTHTAIVRGPEGTDIHTDTYGRFKAAFHWDRDAKGTDADSRWLRLLQEPSTAMFLARSGWEMTVGYVAGDPDRPIGLYRNINGEMPPAYPQPASKSAMSIRTASSGGGGGGYSEIKLDDAAGAQAFDVRAERDYSAQVKNDRKEVVGADDICVVGNDYTSSVKGSRGTTVSGNHAMVGNKNWLEHIKGDRTITIGASESVSIGGGQTLTTKGSEAETIGGSRITIAGGVSTEGLIKMAKEAIPTPKSLVKSVLTGAAIKAIEPAAESVAALKGAKGIPGSLTGAFGGVTRPDGLIGGVEGMIGGYEGAKGALDSAGKALDAAKGLPSAIKSVLPKAQVRALAGAKEAAINALESIVPSPSAILGALLTGSIQRNAKGAFRRTVGAAAVSAAVDEVSVTAGRTFVETVGGCQDHDLDGRHRREGRARPRHDRRRRDHSQVGGPDHGRVAQREDQGRRLGIVHRRLRDDDRRRNGRAARRVGAGDGRRRLLSEALVGGRGHGWRHRAGRESQHDHQGQRARRDQGVTRGSSHVYRARGHAVRDLESRRRGRAHAALRLRSPVRDRRRRTSRGLARRRERGHPAR